MIEDKWKQFEDISDSFKYGSSESNNHSTMTVGKFILALSDDFKFRFISKLFLHENDLKLNYKNWQLIFFVSLKCEWKKQCDVVFFFHSYLSETKKILARHTKMCMSFFFHSYLNETKKNQHSILN